MTAVKIKKSKLKNPVDDERRKEISRNRTQMWKPLGLTQLSCEFGSDHPGVHVKRET